MNKYHDTPGLHVVTLYAQTHKLEEIEELVEKHSIKYPIALNGFWDEGYQAPVLPRTWIIGVEGKIIFAGARGYAEVLEKELAKVKYPGLGKASVHAELEPAARLFVAGKYAEAYKAAEAIFDATESREVEDDADLIMKRIDQRAQRLLIRAESAEVMRDYVLALRCWEALAAFKGMRDGDEAVERLKKLKEDKEVEKEIKASRALQSLMMGLDVDFQAVNDEEPEDVRMFRERCLAEYRKFVADNKGTAAAERCEELIEIFKNILGEE